MKKIILIIFMVVIVSGFVCAEGIDSYTKLIMHMDDAGLTDSSDSSHSVTLNGDAARSATQSKFGGYSAYFDGTGDYLSIPDSDDWNFGSGDFTIDFWVKTTPTGSTHHILGQIDSSHDTTTGSFNIYISSGDVFIGRIFSGGTAYTVTGTTSVVQGNWYHITLARQGNNLNLYVNGSAEGGTTNVAGVSVTNSSNSLGIGRFGEYGYTLNYFNGHMDELRISKGIARWTSDFTPPTESYSAAPPAPFTCGDTLSYKGQNYNTVLIGEQCWFAEDLNVGTKITGITTPTNNAVIEKYCYGNLDANCATDGALYQWNEAMGYVTTEGAQGICPDGWHIPTDVELYTLENGLATGTCTNDRVAWGCDPAGTALKVGGSSGFEAILAGYKKTTGSFTNRGVYRELWSSSETGSNVWGRQIYSGNTGLLRYNSAKAYGYSIRCIQSPSTTPTSSNFTSEETTNFSVETDLENVTGMTLAVPDKGKIEFGEDYEMNCKNQDYDTNIVIEDEFISVNTAALDESFNSSATITLEGVTCPVDVITYAEGTFTSKDDIIAGGSNCELDGVCSNIHCSGSNLTFDVAHFTGFAAGSNANLTIEAEAGVKFPLDDIEFNAWYVNSTDGTPISGECNITFDDDTEYTMDFNSPIYNYTRSFAAAGLHEYNVTCSSANFVTLEANDSKLVSSVDIPEFSIMTLGFGLIAILIGLFVMRKKK